MKCTQFEKMIPDFIQKKMDFVTLESFCRHADSCENCKEELTIQFLVTEGMQRLEEGEAFDLQREMDLRMEQAWKTVNRNNQCLKIGTLFEFAAVAAVTVALVWILC